MLILAAALFAASPAEARDSVVSPPVRPRVEARASVRILAATIVRFAAEQQDGVPPPRAAVLRSADGSVEDARLIEFE